MAKIKIKSEKHTPFAKIISNRSKIRPKRASGKPYKDTKIAMGKPFGGRP
jgi:hypothetical protein